MEVDLKWVINEEERTRHDALFYSQKPKDGFLSGEQARSLFIRSRLPLSELSKIWKLADISRDNLLDVSEFATAMHLIQLRLKGFEIPDKLPASLKPIRAPVMNLPAMTLEERQAYQKIFTAKQHNNSGIVNTETACEIMVRSNQDYKTLSKIWNLSDIDRDTMLTSDEFAIALHLLRICKNGYHLEGSIDAVSLIPAETVKESEETKRQRISELQTEKRTLLSIKEKLCLQISLGENEKEIQENLRPELNQVEERLYNLETEETELRKYLQKLRDKSKKEGFKPFDRNYLVKKRISGEDLFKGFQKNVFGIEKDDRPLFEWLLTESEQSNDSQISRDSGGAEFGGKLTSGDKTQTNPEPTQTIYGFKSSVSSDTRQPPLVNGLSETNHETEKKGYSVETSFKESIITRETPLHPKPTGEEPTALSGRETISGNGVKVEKEGEETLSWVPTKSEKTITETVVERVLRSEPEPLELNLHDDEAAEEDSFSWVPSGKREIIIETVHEEVLVKPKKEVQSKEEPIIEYTVPTKPSDVDDRIRLLQGQDESDINDKQSNTVRPIVVPVQEEVIADVAKTSESAGNVNIDEIFRQMSVEVDSSHINTTSMNKAVNGTRSTSPFEQDSTKLPVGRVLSQEEEDAMIKSGKLSKEKPAHYFKQISKEDQLYIDEMHQKEEERKRVREIEDEKRKQAREELRIKEKEMQMGLLERKHALREAKGKLEMQMSMAEQDEVPVSTSRVDPSHLIELELEDQKRKEAETRRTTQEMKAIEQQQKEKDQMRSRQVSAAKQMSVDGRASVVEQRQAVNAVPRRQKKGDPPPQNNRKSLVELEILRQKEQEDALKQEIARRKQEMQLKDVEAKPKDQLLKREIEICEEKPIRVSQSTHVESQPSFPKRQPPSVHSNPPTFNRDPSAQIKYEIKREVHSKPATGNVGSVTKPTTRVDSSGSNSSAGLNGRATRDEVDARGAFKVVPKVEEESHGTVQQDEFRRESLKREAEELMRQKRIREEELQRRREAALRDAEKRKAEQVERENVDKQETVSRKFAFRAHKVQLEERVLKAMEDRQNQEPRRSRSSSTSSEEPVAMPTKHPAPVPSQTSAPTSQVDNTDGVVMRERRKSVRESLACFESQPACKDPPKEVMRRNRISLNLEEAAKSEPGFKQLGKSNRMSYHGDGFMAKEMQKQLQREEELVRRTAPHRTAELKSNQDVSSKRSQFHGNAPDVIVVPKGNPPSKDYIDGHSTDLETMSEERIRREIEELKQKEKEIQTRRNMLEKMSTSSTGQRKDLQEIKRNPLPSKVQMRKGPAPSAPKPVAAAPSKHTAPQPVASSQPKPASKEAPKRQAVRKSFIELEREKELEREEELKREREAVRQELQSKEEQKRKLTK